LAAFSIFVRHFEFYNSDFRFITSDLENQKLNCIKINRVSNFYLPFSICHVAFYNSDFRFVISDHKNPYKYFINNFQKSKFFILCWAGKASFVPLNKHDNCVRPMYIDMNFRYQKYIIFIGRVPLAHIPIAHIHSHRPVLRVFPLTTNQKILY